MNKLTVIGGGLAGCEAAYAAANRGIEVELIEMKPARKTAAHKSDYLAELVCSNSLKASRVDSAAGLLKEEMRRLGSVCLAAADRSAVAAGGALAVIQPRIQKLVVAVPLRQCQQHRHTIGHHIVQLPCRQRQRLAQRGPVNHRSP